MKIQILLRLSYDTRWLSREMIDIYVSDQICPNIWQVNWPPVPQQGFECGVGIS